MSLKAAAPGIGSVVSRVVVVTLQTGVGTQTAQAATAMREVYVEASPADVWDAVRDVGLRWSALNPKRTFGALSP